MLLPNDIFLALGSPIEKSRREGIQRYLSQFSIDDDELLALADSSNVFHALSAVELSIQFGKVRLIPRLVSKWYTNGTSLSAPIPEPDRNRNDRWKLNNVFETKHKNVGYGMLLSTIARVVAARDDLTKEYIIGVEDLGARLAEMRKTVMTQWPKGLHYLWNNRSFSPLLFIRAVLEEGGNWWEQVSRIRVDKHEEYLHTEVSSLTPEELTASIPFAWEEEILLFGYFLPLYGEIKAFHWQIEHALPAILSFMKQNGKQLPHIFDSIELIESTLHYKSIPNKIGRPYLSNILLLVRSENDFGWPAGLPLINTSPISLQADDLPENISGLGSANKKERAKLITFWAKEDEERIVSELLPLLFQGNDSLDSGIVQILVRKGSWGVRLLLEKAFSTLNDKKRYSKLTPYNIRSIAKYTSEIPEIALPIYFDIVGNTPLTEVAIPLFVQFLYKLASVNKAKLLKLRSTDTDLLYRLTKDTLLQQICPLSPEIRDTIKYNAKVVLNKTNIGPELFLGDSYIEWILERIPDPTGRVLLPNASQKWIVRFRILVDQYNNISMKKDFEEWLENYTIWLYEFLLQEPEAFENGWHNGIRYTPSECILRSRPRKPKSISLAWELIERYGLVKENTNYFKKDFTIGIQIFQALLGTGNLEAIQLFKKFIMEDGITPTHNLCFAFRQSLKELSGGSELHSHKLFDMFVAAGTYWEKLCRRVACLIYGNNILIHPRLINGKIPDIVPNNSSILWQGKRISYAPKIIECKRSLAEYRLPEDILEKYSSYCHEIELWVLSKSEQEDIFHVTNGLKILYAIDIAKNIEQKDRQLAFQINDLLKQDCCKEMDRKLLLAGVYDRIPLQTVEDILKLNKHLRPYYKQYNIRL